MIRFLYYDGGDSVNKRLVRQQFLSFLSYSLLQNRDITIASTDGVVQVGKVRKS